MVFMVDGNTLQEQSSCFYYLVVIAVATMLGHVGVNTITNVEDSNNLHKLSIPILSYISQVWVGCYWNVQFK